MIVSCGDALTASLAAPSRRRTAGTSLCGSDPSRRGWTWSPGDAQHLRDGGDPARTASRRGRRRPRLPSRDRRITGRGRRLLPGKISCLIPNRGMATANRRSGAMTGWLWLFGLALGIAGVALPGPRQPRRGSRARRRAGGAMILRVKPVVVGFSPR